MKSKINLDKNSNDESQNDEKIKNSKNKKPKIEINFDTYLKEKSKIDELKIFLIILQMTAI